MQKLNTNKWCHGNTNSGQSNRQSNKNGLNTTNEIPEDGEKSLLVGSQKRKARKQSITRNAAATTTTTSNMSGNQESNKSKYDLIRIISYIRCYITNAQFN